LHLHIVVSSHDPALYVYSIPPTFLYYHPSSRVLFCTRLDLLLTTVPIASQRGLEQLQTELQEDPYTQDEQHAIKEGVSQAYRRLFSSLVSAQLLRPHASVRSPPVFIRCMYASSAPTQTAAQRSLLLLEDIQWEWGNDVSEYLLQMK